MPFIHRNRGISSVFHLDATKNFKITLDQGLVYELLLNLPEHRAMTGPAICDVIHSEHSILLDESTLRKAIIPVLTRHYGVEHRPKIGYRVRPDRRPPA